jgi:hypothetical protein
MTWRLQRTEVHMSDEFDRVPIRSDRAPAIQRKASSFQEVPGEAEADAARDAFLRHAGPSPSGVASALASADPASRARAVSRLQEERGNAYVQRVVSEARGTPGRLVGLPQSEMVDEVAQRKGSGDPIPSGTRENMEGFFGADLGGVRVHADGQAADLSRELNAEAFTVGQDVFFGQGKYDVASAEGQGLLVHEAAHVGQQTGFGARSTQRQEVPEEEEQVQRQEEEEEEQVQRQEAPEEEELA